jgi:uncharacterized protein (DUF1697 family)
LPIFVGLIRAVNVGGVKLDMAELRALCAKLGFKNAKTYIQSGNVLFESSLAEAKVKSKLEQALCDHLEKPCGVLVRTQAELEACLTDNPFGKQPPNRVICFFLDEKVARGALSGVVAPGGEQVKAVGREVFVYYPEGQGRSKLKLPFAKEGTGRNLNTVAKLAALAAELAAK